MITLKLGAYSATEIDTIDDMLMRFINEVKSTNCRGNCHTCDLRHLCIDLQSAQLYASDKLNSRQG